MNNMFDGQQSDEKILYTITPHAFFKYVNIIRLIFLGIFFLVFIILISSIFPTYRFIAISIASVSMLLLIVLGSWWNKRVLETTKSYITDRRIMRFEAVSPFFTTKRSLFWTECLKAKAHPANLLYRYLHIGSITIEPIQSSSENIVIKDVFYFEDVANYIDKILYIVKNKPQEISTVKPFIPKPKGKRY